MAALNQTHDDIPVAIAMNPWPSILTTIDPSKKISTPDSLIPPSSLSKKWDSSFCISVMCFPVFGLVAF
ncbi:unnamed protein product [Sphagnum tenellum]